MKKTKLLYWIIQFIAWGGFCMMVGIASVLQGEFSDRILFKLGQLFVLLILTSHSIRSVFIYRDWLNLKVGLLIPRALGLIDRKSTRLNASHVRISYAVFCLKKKNNNKT